MCQYGMITRTVFVKKWKCGQRGLPGEEAFFICHLADEEKGT